MGLISFSEYRDTTRESTAATRAKMMAALGLGPDVADVFGHSTPPPWQVKRLLKKLKKDKNRTKGHLQEKEMRPDYGFDRLVRKAASTAAQIDNEINKADREADLLDKEKDKKDKAPRPDKDREGQDEPKPGEKPDQPKPTQDRPVPGRDRKPDPEDPKRRDREKGNVADAEKMTKEQAWLKLLNTSFDRY